MIPAVDKVFALAHYTGQAAIAARPVQGSACRVRWATPDGGTQWCPAVYIAHVPTLDIPERVLVRSKTPRGGTALVEAHPDSVRFIAEAPACC